MCFAFYKAKLIFGQRTVYLLVPIWVAFLSVAIDHECLFLIEDFTINVIFQEFDRYFTGRFLNGLRVSAHTHNEGYA